jgi:hypothetical protein
MRVAFVPRSAEIKPLFWRFVHNKTSSFIFCGARTFSEDLGSEENNLFFLLYILGSGIYNILYTYIYMYRYTTILDERERERKNAQIVKAFLTTLDSTISTVIHRFSSEHRS